MPGFPNRLARLRDNRSQTEFANMLGIEQTYISRYERGKATPGADFLKLLAEKTYVNINWLLTGEGDMYSSNKSEPELADRVRDLERKLEESEKTLRSILEIASKSQSKKKQYIPLKNNAILNYSLN